MNGAAAEAVAGQIRAAGGEAIAIAASVTDSDQVAAMVERVTAEWGRIDILVNNAGILRDRSFAKMEIEDFRLVVEEHLMGAAISTTAVRGLMRGQGQGPRRMKTATRGPQGHR